VCLHFKILLSDFKAIQGPAPSYIRNLLAFKCKSSYDLRSNSAILLEPPKGKMLEASTFMGGAAFTTTQYTISGNLQELNQDIPFRQFLEK